MNAPQKEPKPQVDAIKPIDDRKLSLDWQAIILITGCCLIWGYQQIAIQAIADEVPLLMQLTIRSIIASACVWAWMTFKGIRPFQSDRTIVPGMIAGLLFFAEFVLLYSALEHTNTSRAITFLYLAPFIVALVLPIFIPAERLNLLQTSGLLIAFGGLAFAFQDGFSSSAPHFLLGDIAVIGAATAWAFTTIVLCFAYKVPVPDTLSIKAMASLFLQSVIIAAASYLFWFWLLRHYLATKVSAFSFLTPMFGLLFGFFLAGDPINGSLIAAFVSIALGIYLVNRRRGN